jgi:CheY-like chemotaxis protein
MPKVLMVDDDPVVHLLYKRHLEREGYELVGARNGIEAVEVASRTKPDLILMDVMMPARDGLATIRELKNNPSLREVPVVVLTSNVEYYDVLGKEALSGGAALLLTKPLSPARLLAEVRRLLPSTAV